MTLDDSVHAFRLRVMARAQSSPPPSGLSHPGPPAGGDLLGAEERA